MKKSFLVLLALLPQVSCINVEEFGGCWEKTEMDKRLAGDWKRVPASPDQTREHGHGIGDVTHFIEKDGAYELPATAPDRPFYPVKTLKTGPYQFLVFGPHKGIIVRYKLDGGVLQPKSGS